MSKRDQWLEPRAYRRLMRKEYRRERLLAQFIQRLVHIVDRSANGLFTA